MFESHVGTDVMIIGAGIAGLLAAHVLTEKGVDCIVVDKGESVGGRLATRRIGSGVADHGAQFFTVRDSVFQSWIDKWIEADLVYIWSRGWSDASLSEPEYDSYPRYAAHGGMSALMKYLAKDLKDVRTQVQIATATHDEHGWVFQDMTGNIFVSKFLLMTPPVPQSLHILDEGATTLNTADMSVLSKIDYAPSLTGLFWVDGVVRFPLPGAVQRKQSLISWLADNKQKGISPEATIITIQASDQYSTQMWGAADERILKALQTDLELYMDDGAKIVEAQLKRWKYAVPKYIHPERCMVAQDKLGLVFAGDAFGGPRVEGAALSGLEAGKQLLNLLSR